LIIFQQQIITKYGYPAETHKIVTEDGYILKMHRIPRGIKHVKKKRPPVLLMHGLTFSSADFINIYPNCSLGYILADMGYDVWIGNARGNSYSNRHISIDPNTNPRQFYNFSWHEIGSIDIPAKIDYILGVTKREKLYYIGHSQGCTIFYVMASTKPEYNKKIRLATLMAPATFLAGTPEPFGQFFSQFDYEIQQFVDTFNIYHIPQLDFTRSFLRNLCQDDAYLALCRDIYYTIGGGFGDNTQLDKTVFPLIFQTTPSDASTKQFIHYFQLIKSGRFRQFDYGHRKNIKIYGKKHPPDYNISTITAPIALYYGKNDRYVDIGDVKHTIQILSNVVHDYLIPYEHFNHGDFLFASDVKPLLYDKIFRVMEQY
ncbi:hypothetical protein NQ317_017625, partial [Molorchus minor]